MKRWTWWYFFVKKQASSFIMSSLCLSYILWHSNCFFHMLIEFPYGVFLKNLLIVDFKFLTLFSDFICGWMADLCYYLPYIILARNGATLPRYKLTKLLRIKSYKCTYRGSNSAVILPIS